MTVVDEAKKMSDLFYLKMNDHRSFKKMLKILKSITSSFESLQQNVTAT